MTSAPVVAAEERRGRWPARASARAGRRRAAGARPSRPGSPRAAPPRGRSRSAACAPCRTTCRRRRRPTTSGLSAWQPDWLHAFGTPRSLVRSGRGTRMLWSARRWTTMNGDFGMWQETQSAPSLGLPLPLLLVEVVARVVVGRRRVALEADAVALLAELQGVGVVAVGAADAHPEHLALDERAVLEVLVEDLPVRVVDPLGEQDREVVVEELRAAVVVVAQLRPARVARGAQLDELAVRDPRGLHDEAEVLERAARPIGGTSAHATWREPGPWHASQLTSTSDHVVV